MLRTLIHCSALLISTHLAIPALGDCAPTPTGLVGWWPGDGNANNILGTNNGTLQGGATADATGKVSNAFSFNGTNDFVQIPDSSIFHLTNFSIEAWVKLDAMDSPGTASPGTQYFVFKQNSRTSSFEGFWLGKSRATGTDQFVFGVSSAAGEFVPARSATIQTGIWYHVTAIRGSNYIQLYTNGQFAAHSSVDFPQDYGNHPLLFGSSGQPSYDAKMRGSLDEVAIYDRDLSPSEIAGIYAAGEAGRCKAPNIISQPQNASASIGGSTNFSVLATGFAPLSYQWRFYGTNITGATNAVLTLANLQWSDAGNYSVFITNVAGAVGSQEAILAVGAPPVIVQQPVSQLTALGSNATFSISVDGTPPFTFSWIFNSTNWLITELEVTTNVSSIQVSNIAAQDVGTYVAIVTNQHGATTSSVARVLLPGLNEVSVGLSNAYGGVIQWVDYDNDDDLDLFISGSPQSSVAATWMFQNMGNGEFTPVPTTIPKRYGTSADWADIDNDGDLDLAIMGTASGVNSVWTLRNDGNGQFVQVSAFSSFDPNGRVAWGDFNNDARPDLLVALAASYSLIRQNLGGGVFTNAIVGFHGAGSGLAKWVDYDNDGFSDFLLSGIGSGFASTTLFRNYAGHFFTNSGIMLPNLVAPDGEWGDYNNDGHPDLVLSGSGSGMRLTQIYRNDAGTLTNSGIPLPQTSNGTVAWGDYDNDGLLDLFLAGHTNAYSAGVFRNLGSESFTNSNFLIPGFGDGCAAWGDYDNDGVLDLAVMGLPPGITPPATRLYRNYGMRSNTPPAAPGGLNVTFGRNSAVLAWDAATDAEQNGGLSYNVRIGTSPGGIDVLSPMANLETGFRRVPRIGNAGYRHFLLITNIIPGTYYWSVQAIDHAYAGSRFSAEVEFALPGPIITNHPSPPSSTVLAGTQVVWTVGATGEPPLYYQWQKNDADVASATNATFVLDSVKSPDTGIYRVVVSNAFGVVGSSGLELVVNTPPSIVIQPESVTSMEGTNVTFTVVGAGDPPLFYQWLHEGVAIPGATNSTLDLADLVPADAGGYSVIVSNSWGVTNSSVAMLNLPPSVPYLLVQPQSQYAPSGIGVDAIFSVRTIGTTPQFYQWRFNGLDLPGATNSSLTVTNVQNSDAGMYAVLIVNAAGSVLSDAADLTVATTNSVLHSIPATNIADFVYDRKRDVVYLVSGGNDVLRYHIGSGTYLPPFSISGLLTSLDISFDENLLAVGNQSYAGSYSWIHMVDLQLNEVHRVLFERPGAETGICSVAFGNDGAVISVAQFGNAATSKVRLRRYDPATETTTVPGYVDRNSILTASGDGSLIGVVNTYISSGPVGMYSVTNRGLFGGIEVGTFLSAPVGINHNGTQCAEPRQGQMLPIFTNAGNVAWSSQFYRATIGPGPGAVVYHPQQDRLFVNWGSTRELRCYETLTFEEVAVFDFGQNLIKSRLRMARDGGRLFGVVPNALNWIDWTNIAPTFAIQPASQWVRAGSNATFTTRAFGSPPMRYQWQRDGVSIPEATNSTLALSGLEFGDPSDYRVIAFNPCGYLMSSNAELAVVVPPFISTQPESQTAPAGSDVTVSVSASGAPAMSYQWRFNGSNISGATAMTLSLTNIQPQHAGSYAVVVTNFVGTITSLVAAITVLPSGPSFVAEPTSQGANSGANASFTASARGSEPLSYRWQRNGTNLSDGARVAGALTPTLTLSTLSTNDEGQYRVVVTNAIGVVTSAVVTLVVYVPPIITMQPAGKTVVGGTNVALIAAATGTSPLRYQWRKDNTAVLGATNPAFLMDAVKRANAGIYNVVVTNIAGTVTSSNAVLRVLVPQQFVNSVKLPDGTVVFYSLDADGSPIPGGDLAGFRVIASTNLMDWEILTDVLSVEDGMLRVLDPAQNGNSQRFYRLIEQ